MDGYESVTRVAPLELARARLEQKPVKILLVVGHPEDHMEPLQVLVERQELRIATTDRTPRWLALNHVRHREGRQPRSFLASVGDVGQCQCAGGRQRFTSVDAGSMLKTLDESLETCISKFSGHAHTVR